MSVVMEEKKMEKKSVPYSVGIANWKDSRRYVMRILVLLGDVTVVGLAYTVAFILCFHSTAFQEASPVYSRFCRRASSISP
jgi:hypothetical protein